MAFVFQRAQESRDWNQGIWTGLSIFRKKIRFRFLIISRLTIIKLKFCTLGASVPAFDYPHPSSHTCTGGKDFSSYHRQTNAHTQTKRNFFINIDILPCTRQIVHFHISYEERWLEKKIQLFYVMFSRRYFTLVS